MGNQNNVKQIRGQVRQAVKELMPEVLSQELTQAIANELARMIKERMDIIATDAKEALAKIDARSKDMHSYVIRELAAAKPAPVSNESEFQKEANKG